MTRIIIREHPPSSLFRFFEDPAHASALLGGDVWLSTLGQCRAYEDSQRGDRGEGVRRYTADGLTGSSDTPAIVHASQRLGIRMDRCQHVSITGTSVTDVLVDGFVVCLTSENTPEHRQSFGSHGVEIFDPVGLFRAVTTALCENRAIKHAVLGRVHYGDRWVQNMDSHIAPAGFLKPPAYAIQREWRLLFEGTSLPIAPQAVKVTDIASYVRAISRA